MTDAQRLKTLMIEFMEDLETEDIEDLIFHAEVVVKDRNLESFEEYAKEYVDV